MSPSSIFDFFKGPSGNRSFEIIAKKNNNGGGTSKSPPTYAGLRPSTLRKQLGPWESYFTFAFYLQNMYRSSCCMCTRVGRARFVSSKNGSQSSSTLQPSGAFALRVGISVSNIPDKNTAQVAVARPRIVASPCLGTANTRNYSVRDEQWMMRWSFTLQLLSASQLKSGAQG